jgi:hypothetical protein
MYEIGDVVFHDLYGRGEIVGFNSKDRNMVNVYFDDKFEDYEEDQIEGYIITEPVVRNDKIVHMSELTNITEMERPHLTRIK